MFEQESVFYLFDNNSPIKLWQELIYICRIREDMQNEAGIELVDGRGDPCPAALHLVLFGRASPYLHNGAMEVRDENGEVGS